jgi:hypothetical protein
MISTKGVMLISFITSSLLSWVPNAMVLAGPYASAGDKESVQVMGKAVELK